MAIDKNNDNNISNNEEAHYEEIASQEEIYLEEVEEEVRAILIFEEFSSTSEPASELRNKCQNAEISDEKLG